MPNRSDGPLRIGLLCRIRYFEKKIDRIMQFLSQLRNEGLSFIFLIAGDGPDMKRLKSDIIDKKLSDITTIHGFVQDLRSFFSDLDCMIVPTVGGETGIAGIQAMSAGVPLISVETDASRNVSGDIVSIDDYLVASAFLKKLRYDLEFRAVESHKARRKFEEMYSIQVFQQSYITIWSNACI
jgi:glycosyltransferase involved in cell wall biosynthesis